MTILTRQRLAAVTTFFVILVRAFGEPGGAVDKLASSYNAFGLKLLAQTRQSTPGQNIFLSPAGLAFALSMAANGAQGETLRQIKTALQLEADGPDLNA